MSTGKPMSRREEWLEFWEGGEVPFLRALPYVPLVLCAGFDIGVNDRAAAVAEGLARRLLIPRNTRS
jgi:hypothetical protein